MELNEVLDKYKVVLLRFSISMVHLEIPIARTIHAIKLDRTGLREFANQPEYIVRCELQEINEETVIIKNWYKIEGKYENI